MNSVHHDDGSLGMENRNTASDLEEILGGLYERDQRLDLVIVGWRVLAVLGEIRSSPRAGRSPALARPSRG